MTTTAIRSLFQFAVLACLGSGLVACVGVPVQEMSDARQAVQAALEANATQRAPQQMTQAQTALQAAESQLKRREYRSAKHNAVEARAKAIEARQMAQDAASR